MNYPNGLCAFIRKKKNQVRNYCLIIATAFFLFPFHGTASHIVGGEMSYSCLGDFTFEVRLTVYRDCFYGAPNANFDFQASIGIFDANNNLVTSLNGLDSGQLLIPRTVDDTLAIILSDPCLFAPGDVCVHSMTYVDTVVLPPISGGYQLVYQRCCRNPNVSNILNSDTTGASFVVDISETALLECNSSPEFAAMPPLFLCVNEPFVFDQSVVDVDGDSLVYSLCTPYDGATLANSRPQPPLPPPYDNIMWQDPPYGLDNLLGGVPLVIDPLTGIVTGVPNTQGLFLVGMCIEEYRNGELISTSRREFQYNVGICNTLNADFEAPNFQCGNLEVEFENTSENANEFLWFFNDPANPNATSTEENPSYTYSEAGNYTAMLIVGNNGNCTDTSFADIVLIESTLTADFNYLVLDCTDSVQLALLDISFDTEYEVVEWFWELSDGQTSTEQIPLFTLNTSQNLVVSLTATSSNNCQETVEYALPINLISSNILPPEITLCGSDSILLNPNAPSNSPFTYQWSPSEGLSNSNIASPMASPEEDITYVLTILDDTNDCEAELTTSISVLADVDISISVGGAPCGNETTLTANINLAQGNFVWATDSDFNNVIANTASIVVSDFGTTTYYVQYTDVGACEAMDSITITENSINVELFTSNLICVGDTTIFYAVNLDSNDDLIYTWFDTFFGDVLSTDSTLEIIPTEAGQSVYYFQAENSVGGCSVLDSVLVSVLDASIPLEYEVSQSCNSNVISFSNQSPNAPFYQWVIGNDTLSGANINYEFLTAGTFSIQLLPLAGLPCNLPAEIFEINTNQEVVVADFEWEYLNCENELEIQFTDLSSTLQGNINAWFWTFGNNPTVNVAQNPVLELNNSQEILVQLIVETNEGCRDTISQLIDFESIDVGDFEEVIVACNGGVVTLNPAGNPDLAYAWSPADLLDDANAVSPEANVSETTIFSVSISDPDNETCVVEKTVEVEVPVQTVEASFEYEIIDCATGNVTISFTDTSVPAAEVDNWFWSFSNGQFSNAQNTTIVVESGLLLEVQLQVQTEGGCTDILVENIQVETFEFELPQSEIIKCSGVPVQLNSGGNPDYTYTWTPATSLNDANAADPIANPTETTEYCVTVSSGDCSQESCVTVIVPDVPLMAEFSYTVGGCVNDATIFFQDQTQYPQGTIEEWNWTFSNGTTSDLQNPSLTLEENTTLQATLEVVTTDGCEASISQTILLNLIEVDIPSQVVLCDGAPVQLNPNGNTDHEYLWSPSSGLTDNDVPSPVAFPTNTTTYTVTITDGDCEVVQSVEIIVPTTPLSADFSYTIDDCTDVAVIEFVDESEYAPGEIIAWNWQFSNGDFSALAAPSLTLMESQTLMVSLEVTTNTGCVETTTQTINVEVIDINLSDTLINCSMVGVALNPGGDDVYEYEWSPSTGLDNPNGANPIANPTATTTYNVTVTDGSCEITRSILVIVPNQNLTAGFTYTFDDCTDNAVLQFTDTSSLSNNTITNWEWTFAGNDTVSSNLPNPIITLSQSDTIMATLTVTTTDGCVATVNEEIFVNLIDINVPQVVAYCNPQGLRLNPDGNPAYNYNWSPDVGLSATDVASPIVTGLTETTTYGVTVTFGNCTLTRSIEIIVPDEPLQAEIDFTYVNCIDSAVIQFLDASTYSGDIVAWDWSVFSQTSEEQNPIFTFQNEQAGGISLIVTNAEGCRDTTFEDFGAGILTDVNIPTDLASCNGNGVFLNPDGNPAYNYYWSPAHGLNGDTLSANPLAMPDTTTVYTVQISSDNFSGCVEERTVRFNVPTIPLMAGFEWDLTSCADSAVFNFTDTSAYSGIISQWDWTLDNGMTDTLQNPSFVFQNTDTVDVQLVVTSIDGCVDSLSSILAVNILELNFLQDTLNLCEGDSINLNPAGNPALIYTWTPAASLDSPNSFNPIASPDTTTIYSVTITSPDNIACNTVQSVQVAVPTEPIDLQWDYPADTTICEPLINLSAQSDNAVEFRWSSQPDFQTILSDSSTLTAFPNNTITYYVEVSDQAGCTLTESIEVNGYGILAELDSTTTICYGDSTQLEVLLSPLSPSANLTYTWSPEAGIVLDNNTSTPVLSPEISTEYSLLIENQFGCFYEDTIQVNVLDLESLLELEVARDSINAGEEVQLFATESADWTYKWSPCETIIGGCDVFNPIAAPEVSTTYVAEIEDNTYGCYFKDSISVYVFDEDRCKEPYVFVPQGFTPDDDGLNDVLYVRGNYIKEIHFVIFNRWGEKVFETKDLSEGWDGRVNGKTVPPAVFGYYVELKCFGGEEYLMKGNVTLIR